MTAYRQHQRESQPNHKAERNAAIVEMREAGHTWREIAERFGIHLERARRIYKRETGGGS